MTTRVRATACRLKRAAVAVHGVHAVGVFERNCSCMGVGRSWGVRGMRGSLAAGQLGGAAGAGRAVP